MRLLSLLLAASVLGGTWYALFSSQGGVSEATELRRQLAEQRVSNQSLLNRNIQLEREVWLLREDDQVVDEYARKQFNMVRQDEILYMFSRAAGN